VSESDDRPTTVRIRRAPKISVFLILGGVVGVIVSLILTASFPIDESVGFGATFGYFAIYGVVLGVLVGAVVAIVLDRASSRRAKDVTASVDRLEVPDDDAPSE
jgi:uncharacterized membrane protein YbjE (DUF340 family)